MASENLWHTLRNPDGTWQTFFGRIESQVTGGPSAFVAVGCGSIDRQTLQAVGVGVDGNLWHTLRNADGTWQPSFGLVEGQVTGGPPSFGAVDCAGTPLGVQALHVVGVGNDSNLWHTLRNADGTWQPSFGLIKGQVAGGPSAFVAVGCGSADDVVLQVVGVGNDGILWHTLRGPDGTWQRFFGRIESQVTGGPPGFVAVGCAGDGQALHVVGVANDGNVWHTIRGYDGTWQPSFDQVTGGPGFVAVGCAGDAQALHVIGVGNDGNLWHTIRNPDGTWQPSFDRIESQVTGGPPGFVAVRCANADLTQPSTTEPALQVVGVGV